MGFSKNDDGWYIPTPSSDTVITYCADDGSDSNDGRDPHGFSLSAATYDHTGGTSEQLLTSAGSFAGYSLTPDSEWLDYIYIASATGGVAAGLYEIATRVSDNAITIAETAMTVGGLTGDATAIASSDGPLLTVQNTKDQLRNTYPDWILFKRGDTWTDQTLSRFGRDGRSESERMVANVYGDLTAGRALLKYGANDDSGLYIAGSSGHVFICGIEFNAYKRNPDDVGYDANTLGYDIRGFKYLHLDGGTSYVAENIHIEDCAFLYNFTGVTVEIQEGSLTNLQFRRNIVLYNFPGTSGHSQGMYVSGGTDIDNGNLVSFLIEENLFDNNGWLKDKTDGLGLGNAAGVATNFNQGLYIDNECPYSGMTRDNTDHYIVRNNIVSRNSASGIQMRAGGTLEGNLIIESVNVSFGRGDSNTIINPDGVYGIVKDNVVVDIMRVTPASPGDQYGWGLWLDNIASAIVQDNLVAHSSAVTDWGIEIDGTSNANGDVTLSRNSWWACNNGAPKLYGSAYLTITENNNYYYDASSIPWTVDGTNANAEDQTWLDNTRTAATYNAILGKTGTNLAFSAECALQTRGNWRTAYTATVVNEWIRNGYGDSVATGAVPTMIAALI